MTFMHIQYIQYTCMTVKMYLDMDMESYSETDTYSSTRTREHTRARKTNWDTSHEDILGHGQGYRDGHGQ